MLKLKEVVGNKVYWTYIKSDAIIKVNEVTITVAGKEVDAYKLYLSNKMKVTVLEYPPKQTL